MCLYATYPLDRIYVPNTIAPSTSHKSRPTANEQLYRYPYYRHDFRGQVEFVTDKPYPNGAYADIGPHPSERIVGSMGEADGYQAEANDLSTDHWAFADSEWRLGNESQWNDYWFPKHWPTMSVHATERKDSLMVGEPTRTHHYGMATCENLRPCNQLNGEGHMMEKPGSYCTKDQDPTSNTSNTLAGYCYTSSSGTLECGRTTHLFKRHVDEPYDPVTTVMRCPAGTPLVTPGRLVTRRLLIGGCLNPTDLQYEAHAEVHVPTMCERPVDLRIGCVFPGARNYDPGAVQSGKCLYNLGGCTDSSALNYNSEASHNDGTCIVAVEGCTLRPDSDYTGVDPSTPMYKGRWVGTLRNGSVPFPEYPSVLNYDPNANVLKDCTVAVEGCTDPTAANYNSMANTNSHSWCIPRVVGCMMPALADVPPLGMGRLHLRDGGSANFNSAATVNNRRQCVRGRSGCTDRASINFDFAATVDDGSCVGVTDGCLDRTALNYNCTLRVGAEPCTTASPRATRHARVLCIYTIAPPPAPSPVVPPGAEYDIVVTVSFIASGTVSDYTQNVTQTIAALFAAEAGVPVDQISVSVTAASVNIVIEISVADELSASGVQTAIADDLADPATASAFLAAAAVSVLSTPELQIERRQIASPPMPAMAITSDASAGIGGGIAAAVVMIMLLFGGGYLFRTRRKGAKISDIISGRRPKKAAVAGAAYAEPEASGGESGLESDDEDPPFAVADASMGGISIGGSRTRPAAPEALEAPPAPLASPSFNPAVIASSVAGDDDDVDDDDVDDDDADLGGFDESPPAAAPAAPPDASLEGGAPAEDGAPAEIEAQPPALEIGGEGDDAVDEPGSPAAAEPSPAADADDDELAAPAVAPAPTEAVAGDEDSDDEFGEPAVPAPAPTEAVAGDEDSDDEFGEPAATVPAPAPADAVGGDDDSDDEFGEPKVPAPAPATNIVGGSDDDSDEEDF